MTTNVAIVALGANLGDKLSTLRTALRLLEEAGLRTLAISSFYETVPVGYANQPNFLNAVAAFEIPVAMSAEALLDLLLATESSLGRKRSFPNAPRTCDLDLILFEDEKHSSKKLTLPHPRRRERAFVCVPLSEIFESARLKSEAWIARKPWTRFALEVKSDLAILDASGVRVFAPR